LQVNAREPCRTPAALGCLPGGCVCPRGYILAARAASWETNPPAHRSTGNLTLPTYNTNPRNNVPRCSSDGYCTHFSVYSVFPRKTEVHLTHCQNRASGIFLKVFYKRVFRGWLVSSRGDMGLEYRFFTTLCAGVNQGGYTTEFWRTESRVPRVRWPVSSIFELV